MKLESLTIAPVRTYAPAGENNPYQATLSVSYNEHSMKVKLTDDVCRRILELAGEEIASAAQVQISDFIRTAISVSRTPMIEGSVNE